MVPDATHENIKLLDVLLQASKTGNKKIIEEALIEFEGDVKHVINISVDGVNGKKIHF
jgi:hypothetical protein